MQGFEKSIYNGLSKILNEYKYEISESKEKALNEMADFMLSKLKSNSPIGKSTPHLRDKWDVEKKYKNVKYIYNTDTVKYQGRDVPLLNILEFSQLHGRSFVRSTFEKNKQALINIFKKEFSKNE